eukprot:TRINITY_DN103013_c0_g1_i1.p1 TRINITY_DN103013_c0_g1~~TRINITY_DN103013_c0_g1_i1.p1  ORF type:complete len:272 (-),score=52.07 TRINITY_DN103013_c0_g1_i1:70-885(-)
MDAKENGSTWRKVSEAASVAKRKPSVQPCLLDWLSRLGALPGDARYALITEAVYRSWDSATFDAIVRGPRPAVTGTLFDILATAKDVATVQRAWAADREEVLEKGAAPRPASPKEMAAAPAGLDAFALPSSWLALASSDAGDDGLYVARGGAAIGKEMGKAVLRPTLQAACPQRSREAALRKLQRLSRRKAANDHRPVQQLGRNSGSQSQPSGRQRRRSLPVPGAGHVMMHRDSSQLAWPPEAVVTFGDSSRIIARPAHAAPVEKLPEWHF